MMTPSSSGSRKRRRSSIVKTGKKGKRVRHGKSTKISKGGYKKVKYGGRYRGVSLSNEVFGQVTSGVASGAHVYIGHSTAAAELCSFTVACALVKTLAQKMGYSIDTLNKIPDAYNASDTYRLNYVPSLGASPVAVDFVAISTNTFLDIANWLAGVWNTLERNTELLQLVFVPSASSLLRLTRIDLEEAFVDFKCQSTLKLQNVSLPADTLDDTTDEVDAVTLTGTSFVGKGAGTAVRKPKAIGVLDVGLYSNVDNGLIKRTSADNQVVKDIFRAQELINVKSHKSITMGPGMLSQSGLKDAYKTKFWKWWNGFTGSRQAAATQSNDCLFGNYAIHAFEPAITFTAAKAVTLNYQLDQVMTCIVIDRKVNVTTQINMENDTIIG